MNKGKLEDLLKYCFDCVNDTQGGFSERMIIGKENEDVYSYVRDYEYLRVEMIPEKRCLMFKTVFTFRKYLLRFDKRLENNVIEFGVLLLLKFIEISNQEKLKYMDLIQLRWDLSLSLHLLRMA